MKLKHNFEIGDTVIIKSRPSVWSSQCNWNCPITCEKIQYPFIGVITKLEEDNNSKYDINCEIGNYGWHLNILIEKNLIELYETPIKISNYNYLIKVLKKYKII